MKKLFLLGVILFAATFLKAQAPANDLCSGAQTITPNGSCNPGTTVGSADNWQGTVGCAGNNPEVWYTFTATGSQLTVTVTAGTMGGNIEFVLAEATGACAGLSIAGSTCGASVLTGTINGLQTGNLYYYTISSTGASGTFTSCINNTTPPPVAGQDCATAATLCSAASFSQSTSASGFGVQEVSPTNSCWGSGGERQSKWFKFTVGCSGTLQFNINPVVSSNDYDWALWNITTAGCPVATSSVPSSIACNWSGCKGSTGLSSCIPSEPGAMNSGPGCGGNYAAWGAPITVTAGQTYALLVDNFSTSNNGFNLTFGGACNGGTALLGPNAAFTFTSPSCGAFNFTKSCQTSNSTYLWNFGDGTSATTQNTSHTYTSSGSYIVSLTVTDALGCSVTTSQTFNVGIPVSNAGVDQALCTTAIGSIGTASTAGYTYSWSPASGLSSTTVSNPSFTLTNTGASAATTVYTVTTTSSGCTSTDNVTITVNPSPTVNAGPTQSLTCTNTTTVLAGTSSGGTIAWTGPGVTGGGTTTTPSVNAVGIYTMSVTNAGCTSSSTVAVGQNTIVPTVTATASGSLNCQVTSTTVVLTTTTTPVSYTWTGPGITAGAGTGTATVNMGGTYNYSVTSTANGCRATGTLAVIQNTTSPAVTATAGGSLNCQVTSTTVMASTTTTPVNYNWTGPGITGSSTTGTTTVNAGGTYNYTVTNTSNQCLTVGSVSVTQNNTTPVVAASASGSINCTTSTVQTIANTTTTPVSYTWTGTGIVSGANTASATVNAGGTYNYTVLNTFNQCQAVGSVSVTQSAGVPSVTATASSSLNCQITSTTVVLSTTSTPVTYTWTGPGITAGGNSSSATVNVGGNYIYTVTNTSNSCTATGTVAVIQNTTSPAVTATAGGSLNCQVTSTTVMASTTSTPVNYNWTGPGITGSSITGTTTVNAGGTYNYTVTNTSNQCLTVGSVSVTQNNTTPVVAASASGSINCTTPTVQTIANTTTTPMSYTWTGTGIVSGANTASATVNAGGTYNYTVLNTFNQCQAVGSVSVAQSSGVPSVTATASSSLNCQVTSTTVVLSTTSTPVTYTWTGPGITAGANSSSATVNVGGNYIYTVTNTSNSCTATGTVAVIQNTTAPTPTASTNGTITCTTTTVNLSGGPSSATYTWSAPAGSSVGALNSATTTATGGGTYTLSVTSTTNGCSNSIALVVPTQTTNPTAGIVNNPTITCNDPQVTLNGNPTANVSYTWSGTGIVGATNNSTVIAGSAGVYSLAVTSSSNGCISAPVAVTITSNFATPTITAATQTSTLVCGATSVTLSGVSNPSGSTYSWSPNPGIISTNNGTATVNTATTYVLNSAHPVTGCTTSITYTVIPDVNSPTVTLSPNTGTVTCANTLATGSATSNPSTGVSYLWSGTGIVGSATNAAVSASIAGTYTLSVTNINNNCSSTVFYQVTADNAQVSANVTPGSATVNCINGSSTLAANPSPPSASYTYSWSTNQTTSSITVNPVTTTIYSVAVTNTVNGCSTVETVTVAADFNVPSAVSVSPSTFTLTCINTSTTLTGNTTGATSFSWTSSAAGFSGSTSQSITTAGAGTYTFYAIAANGCSATAISTISPNSSAPSFTLSNSSPSITCGPAPTVSIIPSSTVTGATYSWSPATGIAGSTTASAVSFTAAGTYTAELSDINGCISSSIITVSSATNPPVLSPGTATAAALNCTNTNVTIAPVFSPSNDLSYAWTGAGIMGSSTASNVTVNQNGTYSVTVTNTLTGCGTATMVAVNGSTVTPTLMITSSSTIGISCQPGTNTVNLTAQSGAGVTYTWNTGENTSILTTSTAGVYSVTVQDNTSGCMTTGTISVEDNSTPPAISASSSGDVPCGGGTSTLSAVSSNTNVSFTWLGAGIISGSTTASASVNQPGTFTVNALNNITGCSATSTLSVGQITVNALAAADATTGPAPLNVNFSNLSSGAATFSWSFSNGGSSSQSNPSNSFASSGTYTVILFAINGACSSSDTLLINVLESLGIIPEAVTPNGDNKNDMFVIEGIDSYPNSSLQIFNRWGNLVYSAKPYKNDWDGTPNTAGKTGSGKLPTGTYFYLLELNDANNTFFKGFVQIQY